MAKIKLTEDEIAKAREIYQMHSLLARAGTEQEGERPADRGPTQHLRSILLRSATEIVKEIDAIAAEAAELARLTAAADGSDEAAAAMIAERDTWERFTGYSDGWKWLAAFGFNRVE